jgi:hypothetical protein
VESPYLFFDTKLGHFDFMNLIAKVHKKNVIVVLNHPKKVTLKHMLNQFMRKRNHSYVTFDITAAPKRVT